MHTSKKRTRIQRFDVIKLRETQPHGSFNKKEKWFRDAYNTMKSGFSKHGGSVCEGISRSLARIFHKMIIFEKILTS